MVLICVTCCCLTVFCRPGSSAHSTPAAIEQQEIIVLVFDVFVDLLPLASLQTLLHASLLFTCNCITCSLILSQLTLVKYQHFSDTVRRSLLLLWLVLAFKKCLKFIDTDSFKRKSAHHNIPKCFMYVWHMLSS